MIARVLCDEFGSGSLIVTMLIAILPVLIPEVREWAIMRRENKLEDRLAEVEQLIQDLSKQHNDLEIVTDRIVKRIARLKGTVK